MHELYELKEALCKELEEYGEKGEITASSLEIIDKLAHATKNIGKIIKMHEEEEDEYSMYDGGGSSYRRRRNARGQYTRRGGSSYEDERVYDGRGGGGSSRRNSMRGGRGRSSYAENADMMVEQLEDMMENAPDERTRQEIQRLVTKMQGM